MYVRLEAFFPRSKIFTVECDKKYSVISAILKTHQVEQPTEVGPYVAMFLRVHEF